MVNLTRASRELFRRTPDERFDSFDALLAQCSFQRARSAELWQPIQMASVAADSESATLSLEVDDQRFELNDWSFSQLCKLCRVDKQTVNRVSQQTASRIFRDTQPELRKPLQLLTSDNLLRSVHSTSYSRLYNAELLEVVRDAAPEFTPPPVGMNGGTGLYAGEQDLFAFAIDPHGWVEIGGEEFAPGFFVWNSEVGRRSVGIQTFLVPADLPESHCLGRH